MKKTMFLVALMGAALGSTALAATTYSWDSTTNTTTVTPDGGSAVVYSGSVYTWTGTNATASGANSWKYVSDAEGGTTATIAWDINGNLQNSGNGYHALANNGNAGSATSGNFNTLHFTGSTNNKGAKFDFEPLVIAGVIVDEGATGYSMTPNRSDRSRPLYLGNANTTAAHSSIQEDFTLSSSASATTGYALNVRGTQTWDIASDKTFTLNSGTAVKTISGALSILGGGTASFTGTGITTIAAGTTIDVASGSTLALAGTVNLQTSEADLVAGSETELTSGNGFGSAQYSHVVYTGEGTLSGVTTWQVNGSTDGVSYDEGTHVLSSNGRSETYYINETAASYNYAGAKDLVVRAAAGNLTGLGNMQTLTFDGGSASIGATSQEIKGDVIIKDGSTVSVTSTDGLSYSVSGKSITVEKGGELAFGNKRFTMGHYTLKMQGGTVSGVGEETYGALDFNSTDGKIVASGTDESTISANVRLRANINIEVQEGAKLTMSGLINQNGVHGFTKVGAGELVLSHDNEFTGGVTINAGTVTAAAAAALGTGAVTVNQGATLAAADGVSMTINTLTLNGGSTVNIGDQTTDMLTSSALTVNGNTTINGNLVTADNATVTFNDGAVTLNGSVTIGTGLTIALGEAYDAALEANGHVLLFSGVDEIIGDLSTVAVTGNFLGGCLYSVEQADGSHNIYATPEPATATLSLLALAGLMARRKRH